MKFSENGLLNNQHVTLQCKVPNDGIAQVELNSEWTPIWAGSNSSAGKAEAIKWVITSHLSLFGS